jgi:prevent-host-death family protein
MTLTGTVAEPEGRPVADATVKASPFIPGIQVEPLTTTAGATGRYEFTFENAAGQGQGGGAVASKPGYEDDDRYVVPSANALQHFRLHPITRVAAGTSIRKKRIQGNLVGMTILAKTPLSAGRRQKSRGTRPGRWQLQEAKARFSELVRRAKHEGPQHVTVHGREEVVVVGADDFRKLAGDRSGQVLVEVMQQSPHRSTKIEARRLQMPVRDVEL